MKIKTIFLITIFATFQLQAPRAKEDREMRRLVDCLLTVYLGKWPESTHNHTLDPNQITELLDTNKIKNNFRENLFNNQ